MLDAFLMVAYEQDKTASVRAELVENMKKLPVEELHKIASGELKLSSFASPIDKEGSDCWLEKFMGSPLYQQALQLAEQELQIDIQQEQIKQQEKGERDARQEMWDARDSVYLQKRILELELLKSQAGGAPAQATPPAPLGAPDAGAAPPAGPEGGAPPGAPGGKPSLQVKVSSLHAFELAKAKMKLAAKAGPAMDAAEADHRVMGSTFGALGGGALGTSIGDRLGQMSGGIPQRILFPVAGGLIGGLAGYGMGGAAGASLGRTQGAWSHSASEYDRMYGATPEEQKAKKEKTKKASAELVPFQEKEAFAPALMAGLKGIGGFAAKAAPQLMGAAQRGGMAGLGTNLARQATVGFGRAAQFAKANPLAAATLGAGALGTAALGGAAAEKAVG